MRPAAPSLLLTTLPTTVSSLTLSQRTPAGALSRRQLPTTACSQRTRRLSQAASSLTTRDRSEAHRANSRTGGPVWELRRVLAAGIDPHSVAVRAFDRVVGDHAVRRRRNPASKVCRQRMGFVSHAVQCSAQRAGKQQRTDSVAHGHSPHAVGGADGPVDCVRDLDPRAACALPSAGETRQRTDRGEMSRESGGALAFLLLAGMCTVSMMFPVMTTVSTGSLPQFPSIAMPWPNTPIVL